VGNFALYIAFSAPAAHHSALGFQASLPNGSEEIDLQLHRRKRFAWRKCTRKRHSHRGVCYVTKYSTVERSHGVCVLWPGCQGNHSSSARNFFSLKSDETRNCHVVRFRPRPEVGLRGNLRSAHDVFSLLLDSFARSEKRILLG